MAPPSSTLAWKIPWTEEPGRLQSTGSLRVGHDGATSLLLFTFMHWRRKWQPTPVFLPRESQGQGSWWAAVSGVAQSQTRLRRLSKSPPKARSQPRKRIQQKEDIYNTRERIEKWMVRKKNPQMVTKKLKQEKQGLFISAQISISCK